MSQRLITSRIAATAAALGFALLAPATASASLDLLLPTPASSSTFYGHGGFSSDGLGQDLATGGTLQADVPSGSTVEQAYLYGTYANEEGEVPGEIRSNHLDLDFDGTEITLTQRFFDMPHGGLGSARAEVTAQVAAKVGSGGSVTDFAMNSDPVGLEGVALVVIYSNPASPETTIAVLDGGANPAGDSLTLHLAEPLDPSRPGFRASLIIGAGFSYQDYFTGPHACTDGFGLAASSYSTVSVNAQLLTSCAGGTDDGAPNGGALITVGGVGDDLVNPADPAPNGANVDDERYDLAPFLHAGDSRLEVGTATLSDDQLFLAVVEINARGSASVGDGPAPPFPDTVEIPPPAPTLTGAAPADSPARDATVTFSGDSHLPYECRLDDGPWTACTSPARLTGLGEGQHVLRVRQSTSGGIAGEAMSVAWSVLTAYATSVPAPAACTSRRSVRINWTMPRGVRASTILVTLNGRRYVRLKGSARRVTVRLGGRPTATYRVRVTALSRGRHYSNARTYRTCTAKRTGKPLKSLRLRR